MLDRLARTGLVRSWQACPDSGDLHWTCRWADPQAARLAVAR